MLNCQKNSEGFKNLNKLIFLVKRNTLAFVSSKSTCLRNLKEKSEFKTIKTLRLIWIRDSKSNNFEYLMKSNSLSIKVFQLIGDRKICQKN